MTMKIDVKTPGFLILMHMEVVVGALEVDGQEPVVPADQMGPGRRAKGHGAAGPSGRQGSEEGQGDGTQTNELQG